MIFFLSTIEFVLRCGIVVVKDFLVMVVNDVAHVRHAAVFQLIIFDAVATYIYICIMIYIVFHEAHVSLTINYICVIFNSFTAHHSTY